MYVYRITLEKYSGSLIASGNGARWNSKEVKMLYTASTRALACLENVVHRNAVGLQANFRIMVIEVPDELRIEIIGKDKLKADWYLFRNYPYTQALGDAWIFRGKTSVLGVPSAIIAEESNYLLNPAHVDFRKITLLSVQPFEFDPRIKK